MPKKPIIPLEYLDGIRPYSKGANNTSLDEFGRGFNYFIETGKPLGNNPYQHTDKKEVWFYRLFSYLGFYNKQVDEHYSDLGKSFNKQMDILDLYLTKNKLKNQTTNI
jgi:hypothetical protein